MQEGTLEGTAAGTEQKTTAILIANPTSGSYTQHAHRIEETISFLRKRGWQADLRLTQVAGDAHRLAREAVEQRANIVVAVGGDGTINEIIQELAGSETALGVLPWGTVNVWAREVGIPMDNVGAQEVLIKGLTRRIDLGKVNDRYFLLMAGIGFDGEVTHAVEKKPAKRLGVLGYLLVGTWLGLGYPDFRASLEIDGQVVKINALQIIIGNTQLYGGALKYTWQAKCDDGLLDICILRKQSMLRRFMVLLDFLLHRDQRRQWVRYEKCTTVKIRTRHPVAIQADGDPMGYTPEGNAPIIFTVVPGALKVIVPEQAPGELFST